MRNFREYNRTKQNESYLIRQDNAKYKISIKLSFFKNRTDKSKLQKQIQKLVSAAIKISNFLICFHNIDLSVT